MKMCKRVKAFYRKHLKYPNEDNFDPEFQKILQTMYFFGWFQPKPTKTRILYGVCTFFFLILTHFIGVLIEALAVYTENSIRALVNLAILPFNIALVSQVFLFAFNSKKVIIRIRELHLMKDKKWSIEFLKRNCLRIGKLYKVSMIVLISLIYFFGQKLSIYDDLAIGPFYYFVILINILRGYCLTLVIISHDLLTIFCLMRLEENVNLLTYNLRRSLDGKLLQAGKRNIKKCSSHRLKIPG
jgi:hypothetical protein